MEEEEETGEETGEEEERERRSGKGGRREGAGKRKGEREEEEEIVNSVAVSQTETVDFRVIGSGSGDLGSNVGVSGGSDRLCLEQTLVTYLGSYSPARYSIGGRDTCAKGCARIWPGGDGLSPIEPYQI